MEESFPVSGGWGAVRESLMILSRVFSVRKVCALVVSDRCLH